MSCQARGRLTALFSRINKYQNSLTMMQIEDDPLEVVVICRLLSGPGLVVSFAFYPKFLDREVLWWGVKKQTQLGYNG